MSQRPFSRKGLHRLRCDCGNYTYGTVSALERYGLPVCPCGETFEPERLELALELGVQTPVVAEYSRRVAAKTLAQSAPAGRPCARTDHYDSMDLRAYDEIRAEQRSEARKRRLSALRPVPEALPF